MAATKETCSHASKESVNTDSLKPVGNRVESGILVRKSSIRRRLSSTDVKETFGNQADEYNKIADKILHDPTVLKSIEALQERWKMLMFMYEDTMDMIKNRKERQLLIKWCNRRRELFAAGVVFSALGVLAMLILLFVISIISFFT